MIFYVIKNHLMTIHSQDWLSDDFCITSKGSFELEWQWSFNWSNKIGVLTFITIHFLSFITNVKWNKSNYKSKLKNNNKTVSQIDSQHTLTGIHLQSMGTFHSNKI